MTAPQEPGRLMTTAEVAALFRVSRKTPRRWEQAGLISAVRTLGGHRRYRAAEIESLLAPEEPGS